MRKTNILFLILCMAFLTSCNAVTVVTNTEEPVATIVSSTEATSETTNTDVITIVTSSTTKLITEETVAETTSKIEKIQLKEFDFDNIQYVPTEEYTGINFLGEEQQRSFWLATFVYEVFMLDGSEFFTLNGIEYDTYSKRLLYDSPLECYGTGFTFDSVWNEFSTVFSGDILFEITQHKIASSDDSEFAIWVGTRGRSADFDDYLEFSPVEITEEKVVFQITARYANPDNREEKSYFTYDYEMVLDGENWIMTRFEFWK